MARMFLPALGPKRIVDLPFGDSTPKYTPHESPRGTSNQHLGTKAAKPSASPESFSLFQDLLCRAASPLATFVSH